MTRGRLVVALGLLIVPVVGGSIVVALHLKSAQQNDEEYWRTKIELVSEGHPFSLMSATRFNWDTLHVYDVNLIPLTGESQQLTDVVHEKVEGTLSVDSDDWVLAFTLGGRLVRAIPVNSHEPVPALAAPRSSGFPAGILWVKRRCPSWWPPQPYALFTADERDGPPSTCPK